MSSASKTIGLSIDQTRELEQLQQEHRSKIGHNFSDPADRFRGVLSLYLSLLCVDAYVETGTTKISNPKAVTTERRQLLRSLRRQFGRKPTADDLVGELSRFVTVPDFVGEAIQRDIRRLLA